jgi:phage terminase large subunit GpA-like protein
MIQAYRTQIEDLLSSNSYRLDAKTPSQWAEEHRVMSSEVSPFPGPFTFDRTPYLREILDCIMPEHPARMVAVMKGAQIGFSTGVIENAIGWIIGRNPGPTFFTTGSEDLSKEAMDIKIDQMIDSCGLRHLIKPNTLRKRNQRTGDTSDSKEFPGGRLKTGVTSQHKKIRQSSFQFGFMDDWEAAPVSTHQSGATMELIDQRFAAYHSKMKVFFISTPEIKQTSNIEPLYESGNQRRYFIPCPNCGEYIFLEWSVVESKEKVGGIYYELDKKNQLIESSVGYQCQCCQSVFKDNRKDDLLQEGIWESTAEPKTPDMWSYHLSSLYAPQGMKNWLAYVRQYLTACPPGGTIDVDKYKVFMNVGLGKTWEERGKVPNIKQLLKNTRPYKIGTVPAKQSEADGNGSIVMITCACDLNGLQDDARLDYEITAWSENQASYSITHGSIGSFRRRMKEDEKDGPRERWTYQHDAPLSVWPKFTEVIQQMIPSDDGRNMRIMITGVDTGKYTEYANQFVKKMQGAGQTVLGLKGDKPENFKDADLDRLFFKHSQKQKGLWLVDVNAVKDEVDSAMKLTWNERAGQDQPWGFMNYPEPMAEQYQFKTYFQHYESEHKVMKKNKEGKPVGSRWEKRSSLSQNHFWDCRIYNFALKEILAFTVCRSMKFKKYDWNTFVKIVKG